MGHFYTITGEACHTQATKKGAKNPTRPTTIADARKLNLFPSVNGIIDVLDKPQLTTWKVRGALETAFHFQRREGEMLEDYVARVMNHWEDQSAKPADLGTAIHAGIEARLTGQEVNKDVLPYVESAVGALHKLGVVVAETETVTVSRTNGYAGTFDVAGRVNGNPVIVDFKSKQTKEGQKVEAYESHRMQIAAYFASYWRHSAMTPMRGYNIFISTTEAGRVEVVEHDSDALLKGYDCFLHLCNVWRHLNKHDPRNYL